MVKERDRRFSLRSIFAVLIAVNLGIAWHAKDKVAQGNSDFVIYYTAVQLVRDGHGGQLYDLEYQKRYQQSLLPGIRFRDGLLPYNHPPFEVVLFLPLSFLSYLNAFCIWDLISMSCFVVGLALLLKESKGPRMPTELVISGCLGFLPLTVCLLQGQDSALVFLAYSLTFYNLKRSRDFLAGLSLSLALIKFQVLLAIFPLLVLKKRSSLLRGFFCGTICAVGVSAAVVGIGGLLSYLTLLREMIGSVNRYGIYPLQMHCLRGQIYALLYQNHPFLSQALTIGACALMLGLLLVAWKGEWNTESQDFELKFSLLIIVSLLISPHLNFHDLSILILPGFLIFDRFSVRRTIQDSDRRILAIAFLSGYPLMLSTLLLVSYLAFQSSVLGLLIVSMVLARHVKESRLVSNAVVSI